MTASMSQEELKKAHSLPAGMSEGEFFESVETESQRLKRCPVCGNKASMCVSIEVQRGGLIQALVICPKCHSNALSGRNELKRWLGSVEEAVEDWNKQKGDKRLCLRV